MVLYGYIIYRGGFMKVTTSKSKNSESFYIAKSFINNAGKSTSVNIRKLGTLKELSEMPAASLWPAEIFCRRLPLYPVYLLCPSAG